MTGKKVGEINHYYSNIGVGIIKLSGKLEVGNTVQIQGTTTNLEQEISEMQFDHKDIEVGKRGQEVGVKVNEKVREGDEVHLVS